MLNKCELLSLLQGEKRGEKIQEKPIGLEFLFANSSSLGLGIFLKLLIASSTSCFQWGFNENNQPYDMLTPHSVGSEFTPSTEGLMEEQEIRGCYALN